MLDESILNLQITILMMLGTLIFIFVSFKRRDLIIYLPTYIILPIGYFFIYLQIFNYIYRLLGNLIFLIGVLFFIFAVYYEYFKTIKNNNNATAGNLKNSYVLLSLSPITSLIIGIQVIFSILIIIAIFMLIKLFFLKRSTKYASLIVFLASGLLSSISTILSNFQLTGAWEFSFVAMFILSAIYLMFPIMIYLEEKLAKVGGKLRESEEKFRTIAEESMVGISIIQDNVFKYINQVFLDYLGYKIEEIRKWQPSELFNKIIHPDQREELRELSQKGQSGEIKSTVNREVKIIVKNGEIRWLDLYARSIIYEGRPAGMNISIDITGNKRAEEKLKESEEKFRTIAEESMVGISIIQDSKFQYINKTFLDDIGYTSEEFKSWKSDELFEKIVHPDQREEMREISQKIQSGKIESATRKEIKMIRKNGEIRWIDVYARSIIYQNHPAGMNISIDITERKKTEQKLRESEEKFRTITEQSFIGVVLEQGFNIKYVNHQFSTILGYNSEVLLNWKLPDFYEIIHPDDVDRFKKLINDKGKGMFDKITNFQFRLFKKTGELIWVELFSRKIMYKDGSANLAFLMDITNLKEVEDVIRKENKKLLELDNLRKELITRISHELRTPLTSIYGASQILLQSNKKDVIENIWPYLEISYRGSVRLKELIDNLLDASRLDNKKFELRYSNENLNSLINDCIKELQYLADNRQLIINVDLPVNVSLKLDKLRFEQVLINILSNAIKNTPPHGQIFVVLNETQDQIEVVIKDTGVGLTDEEKTKIFQKFGKIERYGMDLDVDIEGAGLGLYISKEIVKLHGGEILVESEGRNKGCTFIVRLYKLLDKLEKPD